MLATFRLPTAETWSDPWPMYRALRDHDPVHHVAPRAEDGGNSPGYYVLSRHADVWSAACDTETFSSTLAAAVEHNGLKPAGSQGNPSQVLQDSSEHAEFRKLVSHGFAPRLGTMESTVREFVVERIERMRADGGGDIVADLFRPLPSVVVAEYLGIPEDDRVHFDGWAEAVAAVTLAEGGLANALRGVIGPLATMMSYFTELIRLRRLVPGDDTVSQLVTAGPGTQSMLAFIVAMIANGIDTTTGMLAGSVQLLHQRPDQRTLLVENPELIPGSIDEFLRLTSPVQAMSRTVTRDVTIRGTAIPEGRQVLLLYGSANRDERQYGPDAGDLDVRRQPRNVVSFSQGVNRCLGAAAARMQSRVVLTELLSRCPDFEVDEPGIVWANSSHVRRPVSVPFRIGS
ncbi:cytochrome P450 [Mycobacterium malmoense]|uniref:Cytochrome n=1 Tax=Mycobacterium malmoense TaxID=1780 RepID=A0ABX3ST30_MYCMA|nr:cytochrome P450 [Mycobacterium malmoense]ORA82362.1 cytochrome [Mycobacterium malmoense]